MIFFTCIINAIRFILNVIILNIKIHKRKKYDINNDSLTKQLLNMEENYKEMI